MRFGKTLDWALNSLAFVAAILLFAMTADRLLFSGPMDFASKIGPALQSQLALPGVNCSGSAATLVMALSTDCAACDQSVDFYRRLFQANSNGHLTTITVFREPLAEARQYVESKGLVPDAVLQADLKELGVSGTPTLILADGTGLVKAAWMGTLSPAREAAVFSKLRRLGFGANPQQPGGSDGDSIDAKQLLELLRTRKVVPIIDIRPREEFRAGYIDGALNIPLDEIETRMPHEVPKWPTVVVYCNYCPSCEASSGDQGIVSFCGIGGWVIKRMGYQVKLIRDDLALLRQTGIKVKVGIAKPAARSSGKPA